MSNNFPTFSRISIKILSILVNIVLSMKSLGLDAIHFRILTYDLWFAGKNYHKLVVEKDRVTLLYDHHGHQCS